MHLYLRLHDLLDLPYSSRVERYDPISLGDVGKHLRAGRAGIGIRSANPPTVNPKLGLEQ
jgi:hypothetical protein